MKVLITGICGFVGGVLAAQLKRQLEGVEIFGLDNLSRPGSEQNRHVLQNQGIRFLHGDVRNPSDLEALPKVDWVIDAAANPSVLAGVAGGTTSRQLIEHNLVGTFNLLEFCKRHAAGFVLLSTSRVYSLARLATLPMQTRGNAFAPDFASVKEPGLTPLGVSEQFSTSAPVSLYGAAKLASEALALEYGFAYHLPVHVNRCGVLAGAGQFGKPDQGIFAFWVHSYRYRRPLKYIGFGGTGCQVRDCLHPRDLASLLAAQMRSPRNLSQPLNVGGGIESAVSLAALSAWCANRFGPHPVAAEKTERPYDVPWLVLDASRAAAEWNWRPALSLDAILEELAAHAEQNPNWLDLSSDA